MPISEESQHEGMGFGAAPAEALQNAQDLLASLQ